MRAIEEFIGITEQAAYQGDYPMNVIKAAQEALREIDVRMKALEFSKREHAPEENSNPVASTYLYEIIAPGEPSAGIPDLYDEVTVLVGSGDPGGDDGEFGEYMRKAIAEWYGTPTVKLAVSNATDAQPAQDEALLIKIIDLMFDRDTMSNGMTSVDIAKQIIAAVRAS